MNIFAILESSLKKVNTQNLSLCWCDIVVEFDVKFDTKVQLSCRHWPLDRFWHRLRYRMSRFSYRLCFNQTFFSKIESIVVYKNFVPKELLLCRLVYYLYLFNIVEFWLKMLSRKVWENHFDSELSISIVWIRWADQLYWWPSTMKISKCWSY